MSTIKIRKLSKSQYYLDEIDKRLIYELEQNCNEKNDAIAQRLGLSKRVVEYRINRLVKSGIIIGFAPFFDYSKLGYINHEVWMQLRHVTKETKSRFFDYLRDMPQIGWVAGCGGKFDCAIGIMAGDTVTFSKILKRIVHENSGLIADYYVTISTEIYAYPRSYLIDAADRKREEKSLYSGPPKRLVLDDVDLKLITNLSKSAKSSTAELAKKAGISNNTVRQRISKLEERGIIMGYKAIPQPSALGIQNYEVLLRTRPLTVEQEAQIREYCNSHPYVIFMIHCIGRWNLNIVLDAKNFAQFSDILADLRTRFENLIEDMEYVSVLDVHKFNYSVH